MIVPLKALGLSVCPLPARARGSDPVRPAHTRAAAAAARRCAGSALSPEPLAAARPSPAANQRWSGLSDVRVHLC